MAKKVTPRVIIRSLVPELYKSNLDLLNAGLQESHFLAQSTQISPEESEDFLTTYSHNQNFIYLVATRDQTVVGQIYALPRREDMLAHCANIGYLVDPTCRKAGIATALLEALLKEAQSRKGLEIFFAEVVEGNTASLRLLEKFQFQKVGCLPGGLKSPKGNYFNMIYLARQISRA